MSAITYPQAVIVLCPLPPPVPVNTLARFLKDIVSTKQTIREFYSNGIFNTLTARASCSPRKAAAEEEKFERRCQWADGFWASSGRRLRAMIWECPMLLSLCLSLLLTLPSINEQTSWGGRSYYCERVCKEGSTSIYPGSSRVLLEPRHETASRFTAIRITCWAWETGPKLTPSCILYRRNGAEKQK